jgi:competence ComEA-like helix-hairpin-helix protein
VHVPNDARVEILLFLGIAFWCWMLFLFFQDKRSWPQETSMALHWNGVALQMGTADIAQNEKSYAAPAAMNLFLFQPIPVNFADAELLTTISGIGPKMAAQIIKTRDSRGFFTRPQDLLAVPGIGPSRMQKFASHLSFDMSL